MRDFRFPPRCKSVLPSFPVLRNSEKIIFMVAPCIDDIKFFICPTNAHKLYKIIIKTFRIIKVAPTCFGLHKPSSGSYSLCLANITFLVPVHMYTGTRSVIVCISWTNKELGKAVSYRHIGTKCRSRLEGARSLKFGTDRLSRNVGNKLPLYPAVRVMTAQISVLMQAAVEIRNMPKLLMLKSKSSRLETSQMCRRMFW